MLTRAPILEAPDEPDRLPALVDRAALVVDESSSEANPLDGLEVEVGVDVRGFLRPGDPQAVGGSSVARSCAKRRSRSARLVVKKTTTPAPGLAPSFVES